VNQLKRGFSYWTLAFLITTLLQVFRGSPLDALVFSSGTIILLISSFYPKVHLPGKWFDLVGRWVGVLAFVLLVVFYLIPRHDIWMAYILWAMLPLVLALAWVGPHHAPRMSDPRLHRAQHIWIEWALIVCFWEYAANIIGQFAASNESFPTISLVMDPIMDTHIGKFAFIAAWLWMGYNLLFRLNQPSDEVDFEH